MKKIMTGMIFLAVSLFVCSGFIAAPAMAVEGVIKCRVDADCDTGPDSYCTSIPYCDKRGSDCEDEECDGVCTFIDPCNKYDLVCNQLSEFNDERACVECVEDRDCGMFFDSSETDQAAFDDCQSEFSGACIENECFECRDNSDCAPGAECINGECIECVEDADCEPGELCRNGSCCGEAIPPIEPECTIDSDCLQESISGEGEFCNIQGTCLPDGTCDNTTDQCTKIGQYCVEADQKCAWCIEDEDCAGWNCDDYSETTGPICNGEADCRNCADNADCADESNFCNGDSICVDGECEFEIPSYTPCASDTLTVCDEANDRCVEECADDSQCPTDEENTCNGTAECKADGTCGYTGTQCPSGQCLPIAQLCYDCEDNADCANFFTDKPVCITVYDEFANPNTNYCSECEFDADCADGVCKVDDSDPRNNECVDCLDDDDCEGTDTCLNNQCVQCTEDCPCPDNTYCRLGDGGGIIVVPPTPIAGTLNGFPRCLPSPDTEYNVCVECLDDSDCPDGEMCFVIDCPAPIPEYDECGRGIPYPIPFGTLVNECVECLDDSDCDDRLRDIDDPFAVCKTDGVCDNATNTCSYSNPCGQLECYPAGYYNTEDFGKVTKDDCDDSDCPTFDYYCADCANDAACLDDLYCNGVETCSKEGCVAGTSPCAAGLLCEESTDSCLAVDCLTDDNCMFFETCDAENECIEKQPTCGLKINPKQMKANKLFEAEGFTFKIQGIKGQSGFDPNAPKYFGPQIEEIQSVAKKGKLKVQVKGDIANPINPGTLEIWVGNCAGTVVLK